MQNIRLVALIIVLSVNHFTCFSQRSGFTQFFFAPVNLNPSFTGADGQASMGLAYQKRWSGIPGAPTTFALNFHAPINNRLGLGASVSNYERGPLTNTDIQVLSSYEIPFGTHQYVRFGLSLGASSNAIDFNQLGDFANDPAVQSALEKNMNLLGSAGLSLHLKSFHFGFTLPNLFTPVYLPGKSFEVTEVNPLQTMVVHMSNRFYFTKDKNLFEPYLVYRISKDLKPQLEAAGLLHLNHAVWVGSSFKQDFGISALAGIKTNNKLAIGFSYSLKNSGENELNAPSFEVQLGLLLGKKKFKSIETYSFVSTAKPKEKKKTPSQLLAEKKKQEELLKKKREEELAKKEALAKAKMEQEQKRANEVALQQKKKEEAQAQALEKKKAEELAKTQQLAEKQKIEIPKKTETIVEPKKEEVLPAIEDTKKEPEVSKPIIKHNHSGGPRLKHESIVQLVFDENDEHGEEERISRLALHGDNPDELHGGDADDHEHFERHEFVKQGNHQDELAIGDYVIAGVFKSDQNAIHFAEKLNGMNVKADYGHLSEKNLWYVYLYKTTDINQAKKMRNEYRLTKLFRDAWLLTVLQ